MGSFSTEHRLPRTERPRDRVRGRERERERVKRPRDRERGGERETETQKEKGRERERERERRRERERKRERQREKGERGVHKRYRDNRRLSTAGTRGTRTITGTAHCCPFSCLVFYRSAGTTGPAVPKLQYQTYT